jgi:hypothetical protein
LLGLFFDSEDGGDIFIELHGAIIPKTVPVAMTAARTSNPRRGLYLFFCGLFNNAVSVETR